MKTMFDQVETMVFPTLHYSLLINFFTGSKTFKFIFWDCMELHCLGAFLIVETVDSGLEELLGNSVASVGFKSIKLEWLCNESIKINDFTRNFLCLLINYHVYFMP